MPGARVDLKSGAVTYLSTAIEAPRAMTGNMFAAHTAAAGEPMPEWANLLITSALMLTGFVAPELGPAGIILSLGVGIMQKIFDEHFSSGPASISQDVTTAVRETLVSLNIQDVHATIIVNHDWLHPYFVAGRENKLANSTDQEYKDFREALARKISDDKGLIHDVQLLMEPDYRILGLGVFLMGASMVLTLRKLSIIVNSSEKGAIDSISHEGLMTALDKYIKHADEVLPEIDKLIADRMGKLRGPWRDSESQQVGNRIVTKYCWRFDDTENPDPSTNSERFWDTREGACGDGRVIEHRDECQRRYNEYSGRILAELHKKYYGGAPDAARATVAGWKQMRDGYKKLAGA